MTSVWAAGAWAEGGWLAGAWQGMEPTSTHGGGGRSVGPEDLDRVVGEHWSYLDGLREQQARSVAVTISDDSGGARQIAIPLDMRIPDEIAARAMRGTVLRVSDVLGDPWILAALAILIDEADE